MDPRWKHPFTCIVAGPTGCGKTTVVTRLLRNASTMIDPSPVRVTWCYGEWQSAYENLDIPNLLLEEGLPTSFDASKRNIVVLDDLMAETDERVTNLFTKKSHHCNTSDIYLVQNLFPKNKESRTISLNSQYIMVFKNPRDVSQMTTLAKQMYPGRVKFVQEAFADATSTPYGYILVDLKQDTPEDGLSCVAITASLRDIWVSLMIWSAQRSGGRPLGRRHDVGGVEARMSMA